MKTTLLSERSIGLKPHRPAPRSYDNRVRHLSFGIVAALAEFESELIRERTMAGLQAARARGRKGGRTFTLTKAQVRTIQAGHGAPGHIGLTTVQANSESHPSPFTAMSIRKETFGTMANECSGLSWKCHLALSRNRPAQERDDDCGDGDLHADERGGLNPQTHGRARRG